MQVLTSIVLFSGYIAHVLSSGEYENPSLVDVLDIVHMLPTEQDKVVAKMAHNHSCGGLAFQAAIKMTEGKNRGEHHSTMTTLKNQLGWLNSEGYRRFLATSTFDPARLKTKPGTVYLVIPPHRIKKQAGFLRLFLNVILSKYMEGEKAKIPTLFLIDEAPALKFLSNIVDMYKEGASYNVQTDFSC